MPLGYSFINKTIGDMIAPTGCNCSSFVRHNNQNDSSCPKIAEKEPLMSGQMNANH
jgi:hypothetical protein